MELLEINTHFSLCFIINGVTAMLWQLQLTIGKRKKKPTGLGEWKKLVDTHCIHIKYFSVFAFFLGFV